MEGFELFWQTYAADLAHNKKGPKTTARKAWDKLAPDVQQQALINLRELIRYARQEIRAQGKTDRFPHVVTWLNQERYNDIEHITPSKLRDQINAKTCQCGQPVAFWNGECTDCFNISHPPDSALLATGLRMRGLLPYKGEERAAWIARCKAWTLGRGRTARDLGLLVRK